MTFENLDSDKYEMHECVICMENFESSHRIIRIPTCEHFFHNNCLKKWFDLKLAVAGFEESHLKCPFCSVSVDLTHVGSNQMETPVVLPESKEETTNEQKSLEKLTENDKTVKQQKTS